MHAVRIVVKKESVKFKSEENTIETFWRNKIQSKKKAFDNRRGEQQHEHTYSSEVDMSAAVIFRKECESVLRSKLSTSIGDLVILALLAQYKYTPHASVSMLKWQFPLFSVARHFSKRGTILFRNVWCPEILRSSSMRTSPSTGDIIWEEKASSVHDGSFVSVPSMYGKMERDKSSKSAIIGLKGQRSR